MTDLKPALAAAIGSLPARVAPIMANIAAGLIAHFDDVLDQAEPSLLSQARGIANEKQKEPFLIAINECRRSRGNIRQQFQQTMAAAIEKLAGPDTSRNAKPNLQSPQFSLVEDDDLQERIAMQTMVSNANASYDYQLDQINSGFGRLLPDARINNQNNPFAPNALGNCIQNAFAAAMIAQPARLALYRLCKDAIFNRLLSVYQNALRDLQQSGVAVQVRHAWVENVEHDSADDAVGLLFGSSKKEPVPARKTTAPIKPVQPAVVTPTSVSELLAKTTAVPVATNTVGGDLSSPQHLLNARLTAKTLANDDLKPWLYDWMRTSDCPTDLRTSVRERLKKYSTSHTVLIITPEADNTLRFVATLFDVIKKYSNPAIAAPLPRWQMLLAALSLDTSYFFDNADQPPLVLLDIALKLSLGLNSGDKRVSQRVLRCLLQAIDECEENPLVFHDLVMALEKLDSKECEAAKAQAAQTLAMLETQTRRFAAFQAIDRFITERFSKLKRQLVFHELMHQEWRLILSEAYLEGGESGEPWKLAVQLFDEIMLSLQSTGSDQDRTHLKKNLPKLAAGIKVLFDKYSIDENAYQSFADALAEIQRKVLQGIDISGLFDSDLLCSGELRAVLENIETECQGRFSDTRQIGADHMELSSMSTAPLLPPERCPAADVAAQLVEQIKIGQWWNFVIDGEMYFCEYRFYFSALDKLVFFDRSGAKLFERSRNDIINDAHNGYATPTQVLGGLQDALKMAIAAFVRA
jgi:hypothetical protein